MTYPLDSLCNTFFKLLHSTEAGIYAAPSGQAGSGEKVHGDVFKKRSAT